MFCSLLFGSKGGFHFHLSHLCLFVFYIFVSTSSFAQNVTEEWARRYDHQGPGNEFFQASAMDEEGNLYITSTSFMASAFRYGASKEHGKILTLKYSPSGQLLWASTFVADTNRDIFLYSEEARAIAVDKSGGVYIAGVRKTETPSIYQNQDIILVKLNAADGAPMWATEYTDGEEVKEVNAIAVGEADDVYLAGTTFEGADYTDYLIIKYSGITGERLWLRQHNGVGGRDDTAYDIAVDGRGGVLVTGKNYRETISSGGRGPAYLIYDITTIKYNTENGEELWSAAYAGDTIQHIGSIMQRQDVLLALDEAGDVYVASSLIGSELVTVKYSNASGNQLWDSRHSSNSVTVPAITLDGDGGVYIASQPLGSNTYSQFLVIKYDAATGEQLWETVYAGQSDAMLSALQITVGNAGDVFVSSISSMGAFPNGVITIRYNSTSGDMYWERFYEANLYRATLSRNISASHTALVVDQAGNPYVIGSANEGERVNSNIFLLQYSQINGQLILEEEYEAIGSTHDFVVASAVDEAGNSYVAGISFKGGGGNIINIVKYSTTGEELWTRSYSGGTGDRVSAIALDGAGDVYVVGTTGDHRHEDFLTLKLNTSDGSMAWEALYDGGANATDGAGAIALDNKGGVYVTGGSSGPGVPENSDITTIKYNAATGEQVWVERFDNGLNQDGGAGSIAIDNSGGVYVAGSQTYTSDDYNGRDFQVIKYNAEDGEQLWVARYDGGGYDAAIDLAIDEVDGVYVTGRSIGGSGREVFATIKYDATDGKEVWLQEYGSSNSTSIVNDLAVDNDGGVYVTGYSYTLTPDQQGHATYVTIMYEATAGKQAWVQLYGVEGTDSRAYVITTDGMGGVYVTGQSITGTEENGTVAVATLKYNSADGALLWEVLKQGTDENGRTIGLDKERNVYVSGSSFSNSTYGDFLTIKYSQNGGCTPVAAHAITGAETVRAGTQNSSYTISGTGASSFNWSVSGERSVPISGQNTEQIQVDWPSEAGIYEIGVNYSSGEACAASDTTLTVAVYDPDAGFVIGAGWFDSPVNPALPFMQVGGRAHFAFASWYARDARTVPGYTAFRFSNGDLTFTSAAHTPMRLVIFGDVANYTGHGMVNGQEGYGFLVAAVDGGTGQGRQPDRLRLKIWEFATGRVVYDNQMGVGEGATASTAIETGQIVIHRPLGRTLDQLAELAEGASQGVLPEQYSLQAVPSVFSHQATITFALALEEDYLLELYDLNGMRIREISRGRAQAGELYEHTINSKGLSNGLYFLRLMTGTGVQTVKMVLRR